MSLIQQIKARLVENPKATPQEIAKAIGESVSRVMSGLHEISGTPVRKGKG